MYNLFQAPAAAAALGPVLADHHKGRPRGGGQPAARDIQIRAEWGGYPPPPGHQGVESDSLLLEIFRSELSGVDILPLLHTMV